MRGERQIYFDENLLGMFRLADRRRRWYFRLLNRISHRISRLDWPKVIGGALLLGASGSALWIIVYGVALAIDKGF